MWMLYAEQHWTKATDLKSAAEPLYENLGALEFDADHEAIYVSKRSLVKNRITTLLDTINKYISNSDTSDEEEYKAVEENGEGSDTTKEEESKKSKGAGITKPVS
ncbi:hypothetical protein FQA39_LY18957 [Lamprigera yunnana]|nr:hypothetical protein FQA39_LY18957 [Lamprigera yunnana]